MKTSSIITSVFVAFTLTLVGITAYNSLSLYTEREAELKDLYAQLSSREIHVAVIESDGKELSFSRSGKHVSIRLETPPEAGDIRISNDTLYLKAKIGHLNLPHLQKMWVNGEAQPLPFLDMPYTVTIP